MQNLKVIPFAILAMLFIGIVSSYSQDTTSKDRIDSLKVKIESKQSDLEEIAEELSVLLEKLGKKTSKEIEKEVSQGLEEALKELKREMKEINEEWDEEKEEVEKRERRNERIEREIERERDAESEHEEEEREVHKKDTDWGEVLDGLDIKFNKKKDELKDVKTRWFLVDLGFASYIAPDPLPTVNGVNPMEPDILNSISWRLHVLNQRINIVHHNVNLIYGVGLSYNFYGFSNPVTIVPSSPNVNFNLPDGNEVSYKKNHLRASYLHVPLMLNIETNPYQKSKSFHINAGVYGNVLLGGKTSQKTNNRKTKIKDKYNLENFQYGLLGQLGYGPITFYGTYSLNELFKPEKDNGFTVHPITFGVKLIPF